MEKCEVCENQQECPKLLEEIKNARANLYVALISQDKEFIAEYSEKLTQKIAEYDRKRLSKNCI